MPSQVIRTYTYDPSRTELTVTFDGGRSYVYSLVPEHIFRAFDTDTSKGGFFNRHIRDSYPFRKRALDARQLQTTLIEMLQASIANGDGEVGALPDADPRLSRSAGSRDRG